MLAFVVSVFLPLVFIGHRAILGFGLSENRAIHTFPTRWSVNYPQLVSDFFNDNHGFRNALVDLGSKVMIGLGVNSTHPSVIVGKDGWLFFTDDQSDRGRAFMKDFRGRQNFTPAEIAAIRQNFKDIGHAFSRCGVPFVLWLVPNKQTIYGEYLAGFREAKGHRRLDQLVEALREVDGLQLVDARQALVAAKTSLGHDLYYHTDTHWNGLGAFVAYRSLLADLKQILPSLRLEAADLANYKIRTSPFSNGDLATTMLNAGWRFRDMSVDPFPRFARSTPKPSPEEKPSQEEMKVREGVARTSTTSSWINPAAANSVMIFGDSFALGAILYMQEDFGQGYYVASNVLDGEVIGKLRPDVVIEEIVERHSAWLVAKPRNLDKLCGA